MSYDIDADYDFVIGELTTIISMAGAADGIDIDRAVDIPVEELLDLVETIFATLDESIDLDDPPALERKRARSLLRGKARKFVYQRDVLKQRIG